MLNAEKLGQVQLDEFVDQRLLEPPDSTGYISFNAALHRNKAQNFSSLYDVDCKESKGKETTIKADRNILQRLTLTLTLKFDGQLLDLNLYDPISIFIPVVVELILELDYGLNLHNSCRKIVPSGNHYDREEFASAVQTLLQCFLIQLETMSSVLIMVRIGIEKLDFVDTFQVIENLKVSIRSPLNLLCSRLHNLVSFNLST